MISRKRKIKGNEGFTLVELIVAIAILAIVIVPTMEVFIAATKTNSKARTKLQATITANSVLESAKSFSISMYSDKCHGELDSFDLVAGLSNHATFGELAVGSGFLADAVSKDFTQSDGSIKKRNVKFIVADLSKKEPNKMDINRQKKDYYAFYINGIKQTNNTYDAVIVYEKQNEKTTQIAGSDYKASDAINFDKYLCEYKIHVFVYKHDSTPAYVGDTNPLLLEKNKKTVEYKENDKCLMYLTGSKLDSAIVRSAS